MGPGVEIVGFYLRVQGCRVQTEQSRGTRLMASGLVEGPANQVDLKLLDLVIKVDAARDVDVTRLPFGRADHFGRQIRIADLRPQTVDGKIVSRCDNHRTLDNVL